MVETHLVKVGQGEYLRRYVQAVPIRSVPGDVLDSLQTLTTSASHCQALASAAAISMTLRQHDGAIKDVQACAKYAEAVLSECLAVAVLIDGGEA